jgi:ribonuclease R
MNIKEKLLEIMGQSDYTPKTAIQLMNIMGIEVADKKSFLSVLDALEREGSIVRTKTKKYGLPKKLGYVTGRFQANVKGFGFIIPDDGSQKDVYVSADDINGAMNGDRVMAKILFSDGDRSREGQIVQILERANERIVGTIEKSQHFAVLVPDDPRLHTTILIPGDALNGAQDEYKVVIQVTRWPRGRIGAEGRVIEVLGHKDDVGTDILSIIRQYELPEEFPPEVMEEAASVPQAVSEEDMHDREDLRDLHIVTIDGEDAKDLDDAVSISLLPNGHFLLGVHIADVSHYVKEGGALDKEALSRGCSVYPVDRVIPMLPPALSNGICSLNPRVDRLTLSVFMEIDNKGKVVEHRFTTSVIKTCERMTYTDVTKLLTDPDDSLMDRYGYLIDDFKLMEQLRGILRQRRRERGSIDFDIDEAQIKLDLSGKPTDVLLHSRGIADEIIEEFMLVCNETVAEHMFWAQVPFIYRVHEEPDPEKILAFNDFIHNLGYHLKGIGGKIHPKALQDLLNEVKGTEAEAVVNSVLLRSLQRARYDTENIGHFGLAARYYTHFTSPIRRYPDLMIHRIIKDMLYGKLIPKRVEHLAQVLPSIAQQSSQRERVAQQVEWDTEDLKKAEYMMDKIGQSFDGIISGITHYGMYVQLENTIEGLIHVSALDDDYYVYNEKHYCFIGEHTRKIYRLGDKVRVKVAKVELSTRNIDFVMDEGE